MNFFRFSSIELSAITAAVYSTELSKRLGCFLAMWPPSSPLPHVNDLLIAMSDFERNLESWNIRFMWYLSTSQNRITSTTFLRLHTNVIWTFCRQHCRRWRWLQKLVPRLHHGLDTRFTTYVARSLQSRKGSTSPLWLCHIADSWLYYYSDFW